MTISKKVQFTVHKTKDIIIELRYPHDHSKGVFWSYEDGVTNSGPFHTESQAIEDAKLYSTYGTTSKDLLLKNSRQIGEYSDRNKRMITTSAMLQRSAVYDQRMGYEAKSRSLRAYNG